MAKESWVDFWKGQKHFFPEVFRLALEHTQSPIHWALGTLSQEKRSQGVKPFTHSTPPSAQVINACSHTLTPYAFKAWCLLKHTDHCTFFYFIKFLH
jgi:hypothetical protein